MRAVLFPILLFAFLACQHNAPPIFMGQGTMVGEVTSHSAILQTRITATKQLTDGDLPGADGWVKFSCWEASQSQDSSTSGWRMAKEDNDHIVKWQLDGLNPNRRYNYKAVAARDTLEIESTQLMGQFRTLPGPTLRDSISFVVVTGMNYYFFHFGNYDQEAAYRGEDKHLGYPALEAIHNVNPDYFIGTGDNVYFDHPATKNYQRALDRNKKPLPGLFHGKEVIDEPGMRKKYHVQFAQSRFQTLFSKTATYWQKDDHDYRVNDGDPFTEFPISHELGIKNFREQLPVVDPNVADAKTYRTHRMTRDLQLWFIEGRDFRSANSDPDGPAKTLWGETQREWLKKTLLSSDARFKIIVSPTPMVGPDDAYKKDNHVNPLGFRSEGDSFFQWLQDHSFSPDSLFIICGDRHWQYHAIHPSGYQEFSCGALVDANSRAGRLAGDPESTDPDANIKQRYVQGTQEQATGGFLLVKLKPGSSDYDLSYHFLDERGRLLYQTGFNL